MLLREVRVENIFQFAIQKFKDFNRTIIFPESCMGVKLDCSY